MTGKRNGKKIGNNTAAGRNRRETARTSGQEYDPKYRYRQEELAGDWSEDWVRPVDENRMTPAQYVLLFVLVVLLGILAAFWAFWTFGRSTDRDPWLRGAGGGPAVLAEQEGQAGNGQGDDAVTILDP